MFNIIGKKKEMTKIYNKNIYLVLVSARSPLTESNVVLSKTPLLRPIFKCRADFAPDSNGCSTIHKDSAPAGKACIERGDRQSCK